jgi:hypothetical protein
MRAAQGPSQVTVVATANDDRTQLSHDWVPVGGSACEDGRPYLARLISRRKRPRQVLLPATIHSFDVDMRCGGDSMAVGVWRSVSFVVPVRIGVRCSTLDGKRLR